MNIRNAILAAADHIEEHPALFNYHRQVPTPDCGSPGCALGWISLLADEQRFAWGRSEQSEHTRPWKRAELFAWLGYDDGVFYDRMDALDLGWKRTARQCAAAMRLYADKYHPAPKLGIPASVLAIFEAPAIAEGCLVNTNQ